MAASDHISKIQMRRFPGDHADTHPVETSDDMLVEELLYDGRKDEDDSHTVDLESPGVQPTMFHPKMPATYKTHKRKIS